MEAADLPGGGNLAGESLPELLVRRVPLEHQLDRDFTPTWGYPQENPPHAASAQPAGQPVHAYVKRIARLQWFHRASTACHRKV
jgi:hypothetical protein